MQLKAQGEHRVKGHSDDDCISDGVGARGWQANINRHLQLLNLERPFGGWASYASKRRRMRKAAELVLSGWSRKEVRHWADQSAAGATLSRHSVHSPQHAKAHTQLVEQETQRRIELGKRVIRHILHHQLAMAWDRFVHSFETRRRTRQMLHKVISRMQRRQLSGAFDRCHDAVAQVVRKRHIVGKVAGRWRMLRVGQCFERWVEHVDRALMWSAEKAQKVLKKLLHREVSEVFDAWRWCVGEERLQPLTCDAPYTHLFVAWHLRLLAWTLEEWKNAKADVLEQRLQSLVEAQATAKQTLIERVKMSDSKLSAAMERRTDLCTRLLRKMLNHQLMLCWNLWVSRHKMSTFDL